MDIVCQAKTKSTRKAKEWEEVQCSSSTSPITEKMWATQQEWTSLPRPAPRLAVAAAEEQRAVLIEPVSSTGCMLFEVCFQIFRCDKQN